MQILLILACVALGAFISYEYRKYNNTRDIREARKHYIKVSDVTLKGFRDEAVKAKFILNIKGQDYIVVKHSNGHYYATEVKTDV